MARDAEIWFETAGLRLACNALQHVSHLPSEARPDSLDEDDITLLVKHGIEQEIRKGGTARAFVVFQHPTYDASDVAVGRHAKDSPKIDLVLHRGDSHGDVYLSIEAKILVSTPLRSWRRTKQAREYVRNGMCRFLDGRYARGMRLGVMIGYVRNGAPVDIVKHINKCIKKDALPCVQHIKRRCASRRVSPHHYRSVHPRNGASFALHHLFERV